MTEAQEGQTGRRAATPEQKEKKGFPLSPKQVVGLVVLLLVVIFCAQNTRSTTINFFTAEIESSLWIWFLGVLAIGVLVGFVLPYGRKKD